MANGSFDLRCAASPSAPPTDVIALQWPAQPGESLTIRSGLGWSLDPWAVQSDAAADLVRVAAGAYLADALTTRGTTFTRDISLAVAVSDPDIWTTEVLDATCDLLYWLTGDQWLLSVTADDSGFTGTNQGAQKPEKAGPVSLLSGGLDSFLGAIHLRDKHDSIAFVGHKDAAKVIRGAQTAVQQWLSGAYSPMPSYARVPFGPVEAKRERSSRSRSLLFFSLGVAAATAHSSDVLYVPENGYTSLNVPLHPNRAGALSTRSTHPLTFERINSLLAALGIDVTLENPFEWMTKGEAMLTVAQTSPPDSWLAASWQTISCSKLDGGHMAGGNPNYNCGLCVPCLVRRATYLAADQEDKTRYLVNEMSGSDRDALIGRRQGDLDAVTYGTGEPVEDALIDAQSWPRNYDLDRATDLVQRGLDELALVPKP